MPCAHQLHQPCAACLDTIAATEVAIMTTLDQLRDEPEEENVNDAQVAKYGADRKQASVEDIEQAVEAMTRGDTYQAERGKRIANAAAVNKSFVSRASAGEPVGTKVLECGKNDRQAWARVAAFRGTVEAPLVWAEEHVVIDYELTRQKLLWDAIDKGVWFFDPAEDRRVNVRVDFDLRGDVPVPRDPRVAIHLIRLALAKKIFAEREAVTHARERAQRQVLASEWREQGEREAEQDEMDEVDRLKAERGGAGVDLDAAIPFGPLRGQTWRGAAATPEGRTLLQGVTTSAKVEKYATAARAALAEVAARPPVEPAAAEPSARAPDEVAPTRRQRAKRGEAAAEYERAKTGPTPGATPSGSAPAPAASPIYAPADSKKPPSPGSSPASTPSSGAGTAAPAGGPAPAGAAIGSAPAPRPEPPPPPAASFLAIEAERDLIAAREKETLLKAITTALGRWPRVVVEDQLAGYELAISTIRGKPTTFAQADVEDVRRLYAHVCNHDQTWTDAVKLLGGPDAALARLDDLARERRVEKFFAPAMRRSVLEEIRQALVAGPTPPTAATQGPT